jgi:hypothetical protein
MRRRVLDWDQRLIAAIAAAERRRFRWGRFDCCMFAVDVVTLIRGRDPAPFFRGRYDTKRGAMLALRDFAGGGLLETAQRISREEEIEEIPITLAQRGDVAFLVSHVGDALAIVLGDHVAIPGRVGIQRVPLSQCSRIWAV